MRAERDETNFFEDHGGDALGGLDGKAGVDELVGQPDLQYRAAERS